MRQSVISKTLNSQSKLFVASKKGEGQHLSSVFLSFSNYRMRGLLVGFHFCPVLLSGVALFLVAFSSSLHTDLSRDEVFERIEGNTAMCYTSQRSDIFFPTGCECFKCHGRNLGSDDTDFGCVTINFT